MAATRGIVRWVLRWNHSEAITSIGPQLRAAEVELPVLRAAEVEIPDLRAGDEL